MKNLIEELYEIEAEKSIQMEILERTFEQQLNVLVSELLEELPEEQKDAFKERLIGMLIPIKKKLFVAGFKSAIQLLAEGIL